MIRTDDDFTSFYLMKSNGTTKLKNDHVWLSVFSRPLRSRHTRKQRVSLCMAFVCLSFLAGAMLYRGGAERITDGLFTFGMLSFDPLDVRNRKCSTERCKIIPAKLREFQPIFPKMADLAGCGSLLLLAEL